MADSDLSFEELKKQILKITQEVKDNGELKITATQAAMAKTPQMKKTFAYTAEALDDYLHSSYQMDLPPMITKPFPPLTYSPPINKKSAASFIYLDEPKDNNTLHFNDTFLKPTSLHEDIEMAVKKTTKAGVQKNADYQKAWLDGFQAAHSTKPSSAGELFTLVQSQWPTPPIMPELKVLYFYKKLPDEYTAMAVRFNPEKNTFEIAIKTHYYEIIDALNGAWNKVKFGAFYPLESADSNKTYGTFFYYVSHYISSFWMSTFFANQDMFNELKKNPYINADIDPVPDYVHQAWKNITANLGTDWKLDTNIKIVASDVASIGGLKAGELDIIVGTPTTVADEVEFFEVDSEKEDGTTYKVTINKTSGVNSCECKSYVFSKKKPKSCKHIIEVLDSMDFEDELAEIKIKLENDKNSEIVK